MFIINKQQVLNKLNQRNKKIDKIAKDEALIIFKEKEDAAKDKFDSHEITQELKKSGNTDDAPDLMGGRSGNLRAFIGFDSSDDPAGDLKKFLF